MITKYIRTEDSEPVALDPDWDLRTYHWPVNQNSGPRS